jgi:hypothetical protein
VVLARRCRAERSWRCAGSLGPVGKAAPPRPQQGRRGFTPAVFHFELANWYNQLAEVSPFQARPSRTGRRASLLSACRGMRGTVASIRQGRAAKQLGDNTLPNSTY